MLMSRDIIKIKKLIGLF